MFGVKETNKRIDRWRDSFIGKLANFNEIVALHSKKLAELKQYVECSVCGSLVSKEKAKVEWSLEDKEFYNKKDLAMGRFFIEVGEKEAVKKFTCLHCQKGKRK